MTNTAGESDHDNIEGGNSVGRLRFKHSKVSWQIIDIRVGLIMRTDTTTQNSFMARSKSQVRIRGLATGRPKRRLQFPSEDMSMSKMESSNAKDKDDEGNGDFYYFHILRPAERNERRFENDSMYFKK